MDTDGYIPVVRAPGVEYRRVRDHRVLRYVRVHASPAPAQKLPEAQEAHGRVLRHIPQLYRRVRVLVRQLVERRLGCHGHGDRHQYARGSRLVGRGHMRHGLHEDPAQHCRTPHCRAHRQLRRILRGAHAVPHRIPSEISHPVHNYNQHFCYVFFSTRLVYCTHARQYRNRPGAIECLSHTRRTGNISVTPYPEQSTVSAD